MRKSRQVQPEKLAALNEQRARRTEAGAVAMAQYQKTQLAARDQLRRLHEARLSGEQVEESEDALRFFRKLHLLQETTMRKLFLAAAAAIGLAKSPSP